MISGRRCETAPTWKNRQELELLVPTWNQFHPSGIDFSILLKFQTHIFMTNVNNTIHEFLIVE